MNRLALLLLLLVEFTSRAGSPIAVNPDAVEAVFPTDGQHAELRLISGQIVDVSESYAVVVRRLRNGS